MLGDKEGWGRGNVQRKTSQIQKWSHTSLPNELTEMLRHGYKSLEFKVEKKLNTTENVQLEYISWG
jgi:hypothetical protein